MLNEFSLESIIVLQRANNETINLIFLVTIETILFGLFMKCIEIIRQIVLSSALRDEPSVMNKLVLRYKTYAINIGLPHYHAKANIFDLLCTHLQLRRLACRIHHRAMTWHCKSAFDIDGL